MISGFFIDRPKFAIVLAILITLLGALALLVIPVAQYPDITPPQISVTATYPGADAQTIADTVAEPIEEQVNGVKNELYMSSTSSSSGTYTLTVTFTIGSDPDIDQVNVQNRVALAEAQLPISVSQQGLKVTQQSSSFLLAINLYSPGNKFDENYIANYANINLNYPLSRIAGVGSTSVLGNAEYAMRVWMNPLRMTALNISPTDVINAIDAQNVQSAAGQIGAAPTADAQQQQLTIVTQGRLTTVDQFRNIIVRANANGGIVRVGDVAQVALGAQTYASSSKLNDYTSSTLGIYQAPGANALAVASSVRAEMAIIGKSLPPGLAYAIVYDSTQFVSANIQEILTTLAITLGLVVVVVFLFLQDWRATLIPLCAVPVSLVGVFAVLYAIGYSANTIDLFAIVLAITLVVDDAIVVVENVTRNLEEHPERSMRDTTRLAMGEITGPVIATTLVLVAVSAPVGFLPGITGQLFRQFAVTIAVSVTISAFNALTLSPALCVLMLRPPKPQRFSVFRLFNRGLDFLRDGYTWIVRWLGTRLWLGWGGLLAVFVAAGLLFVNVPSGFIPDEDQGYFFVNVSLPDGAALVRTQDILERAEQMAHNTPGVANVIELSGFSLISGSQEPNGGALIVILKPWAVRGAAAQQASAIIAKLQQQFNAIPSATLTAFNPPAIPGLGRSGGFDFEMEGHEGQSSSQMAAASRALIYAANQSPALAAVFTTFSAAVPEVLVSVNASRAEILGVAPADIYTVLQAHLGSQFVNYFNLQSQVFQVIVQDNAPYRDEISNIGALYVRSTTGALVPLNSLVTISTVPGANTVNRYNLYPSVEIDGGARGNTSTGQAIAAMASLAAAHLPHGYGFDWTSISFQQLQAGSTGAMVMGFALIFAYLFMVAQYESWSLPVSVILSVVVAVVGALGALLLRGFPLDVYGNVGLVLLIGLAAKNAILIVEFAKTRLAGGETVRKAAEDGARTRFRPVLMTATAFIIGVLPLVFASGAGAGARQSIGTTVFGGMVLASFVGIVFVPLLFVSFELLSRWHPKRPASAKTPT
jgi:multidrug efflux pump